MILAKDAGLAGANPTNLVLCMPGTLDPAKVTGKIVVCDRGVSARVDKSLQVKNAGGVGMILVNPTASTLDSDLHSVPSVHLDDVADPEVKAYVAGTAQPDRPRSRAAKTVRVERAEGRQLVEPRPVPGRQRRPAQAGHDGAGHQRARRDHARSAPPVASTRS